MMDFNGDIQVYLSFFRREKRRLLDLSGSADAGPVRDALVVIAAWLEEANDRVPRLLAGAPPVNYDVAAFAAEALKDAGRLDVVTVAGRLRRAADRYEIMVSELTCAVLRDEPDAGALIERVLRTMAEARVSHHGPGGAARPGPATGEPA